MAALGLMWPDLIKMELVWGRYALAAFPAWLKNTLRFFS